MFGENSSQPTRREDIRFTCKGGALYAIALGWPKSGTVRIAALAEESALAPGTLERVEVLGSPDSVPFQRSRKGLEVRLPQGLAGAIAVTLKIRGPGLA